MMTVRYRTYSTSLRSILGPPSVNLRTCSMPVYYGEDPNIEHVQQKRITWQAAGGSGRRQWCEQMSNLEERASKVAGQDDRSLPPRVEFWAHGRIGGSLPA